MTTKIEYCDETLNPQGWGCYVIPHWHPEQLEKPLSWKRGRKIFWQSMGDLFHPYSPQNQILAVKDMTRATPQHTHIFLTKNPSRLCDFNPWPPNCHVGTTVTNQADADERLPWLLKVDAPVRFVSHEPLLGEINIYGVRPVDACHWVNSDDGCCTHPDAVNPECHLSNPCSINLFKRQAIDWAIIGAQTGPGAVKPKPKWVQGLIDQYRVAGVPVFLKDNLNWPVKIQEFPVNAPGMP